MFALPFSNVYIQEVYGLSVVKSPEGQSRAGLEGSILVDHVVFLYETNLLNKSLLAGTIFGFELDVSMQSLSVIVVVGCRGVVKIHDS